MFYCPLPERCVIPDLALLYQSVFPSYYFMSLFSSLVYLSSNDSASFLAQLKSIFSIPALYVLDIFQFVIIINLHGLVGCAFWPPGCRRLRKCYRDLWSLREQLKLSLCPPPAVRDDLCLLLPSPAVKSQALHSQLCSQQPAPVTGVPCFPGEQAVCRVTRSGRLRAGSHGLLPLFSYGHFYFTVFLHLINPESMKGLQRSCGKCLQT